MQKKHLLVLIFIFSIVFKINADDLADLLQDLAIQTACLGWYSTAQTGVTVTSRYDDPPDWYTPPMMANRFAKMSGEKTRTDTFYGICFDYAQFAWNDIMKYQSIYNTAGMKDRQWYIATTFSDPNTIILYDPTSMEKADFKSNGVYLKENSRHRVRAHDNATGHAWLWVQHKNGTWYWIDPTWTDNTGYPWWGIVENGKEVQYYPDQKYTVADNYPRPNSRGTQSPSSTYVNYRPPPPPPQPSSPSPAKNYQYNNSFDFYFGYNYVSSFPMGDTSLPLGITLGFTDYYFSVNLGGSENSDGFIAEWIIGIAFPVFDFLFLPIGLGANHSGPDDDREIKFVMEIGLMPVLLDFLYVSATYRLIDFNEHGFTIGAGLIF